MANPLIRASSATNTKVAVGATTTAVLTADGGRQTVILTNDSDEEIYIAIGAAAVMNEGIRLDAVAAGKSSGQLILDGTNLNTAAINAICTSGSKNLCVTYY